MNAIISSAHEKLHASLNREVNAYISEPGLIRAQFAEKSDVSEREGWSTFAHALEGHRSESGWHGGLSTQWGSGGG